MPSTVYTHRQKHVRTLQLQLQAVTPFSTTYQSGGRVAHHAQHRAEVLGATEQADQGREARTGLRERGTGGTHDNAPTRLRFGTLWVVI